MFRPNLRTTAALAALTLAPSARADFQAVAPPDYAGSSAAQFAYWGGDPGNTFTGFSSAFGAPNAPNDPSSDLAATLTQWTPGAVLTSTGNIYGVAGALSLEVRATLPADARAVTLQLRTLGTGIDVTHAQLTLSDGVQTVPAGPATRQLLLQIPGGFVVEEWRLDWDVSGLALEATELVLTFDSLGANTSLDDVRLDVLHDGALSVSTCAANPNSTGAPARATAHGDDTVAANDLVLRASSLPLQSSGYFLVSRTAGFSANPGGSQGDLCLQAPIGRFVGQVQSSGTRGMFEVPIDLTSLPLPTGTVQAQAGETWHFQAWYRDANPTPTSNFTDGIAVTLR